MSHFSIKKWHRCVCQILKEESLWKIYNLALCFLPASKISALNGSNYCSTFKKSKLDHCTDRWTCTREVTSKSAILKNLVLQVIDKETCFTAKYFCCMYILITQDFNHFFKFNFPIIDFNELNKGVPIQNILPTLIKVSAQWPPLSVTLRILTASSNSLSWATLVIGLNSNHF